MADRTDRINEIQELLASGVTSVTVDGTTTQFDHASLRTELRRLQAEDDVQKSRRPFAATIDLSGI